MCCEVGGRASRSLRVCVGAVWGSGSAREGRVAVRGRAKGFGGEWVVRSARNAWRSLRVCVGAAWGSGSVREGSEKVLGREQVFGEEWVVRSAGLTHFRRSSSRVRVLLYIRPPRHRREIKAMGTKDAPCEHPSPAKPSAPAPSAFTLPRRRSHFPHEAFGDAHEAFGLAAATFTLPRPRSHFPRIPFGGAHEDFGPPQQQLSTMGYPRKSYPHRCSPPCAKRSRPRACARVYIIYRSPVGRSRECPRRCGKEVAPLWPRGPRRRAQGGGGRRQRRTPPCAATRTFPAYGRAPARLWRSAVRKGGSAQGNPRPLPPTAPPPPPKWEPRLRRREGKPPNGAPPHHNAHTPNAERKRYLHNSRTKTQRRTKRCAQFVIFVFTPCKLLHNFSTVLHRSPRNVPESAQIAVRRSDFQCFTARFPNVLPESHRAKHPRTAPVLPPKNAPLRAYAKPRPHSRVRGTRQHATTCAFFTFSARYERGGGARNANFCPAEGRKWGRFRSQMLKNGPQTKKSTFSFGRLVI